MRKLPAVVVLACILSLLGAVTAFADACDDIWDKAKKAESLGKNAEQAEKFGDAARYYEEAARHYGEVGKRTDCQCPKIAKSSRHNAELYAELADWAKGKQKFAKFEDRFKKAKAYDEKGRNLARKGRFAEAAKAFSLAEQSWKNASGFADAKNKKWARERAAASAKYASMAKARVK